MNNTEKYKRAFSIIKEDGEQAALRCMANCGSETQKKRLPSRKTIKGLISAAAAILLVAAMSAVVYAANIGRIREKATLWFFGKPVEGDISRNEDGSFRWTSPGHVHDFSGIKLDENTGEERDMTIEELIEDMNSRPQVWSDENGVFVSYHENTIDITDDINNTGKAEVVLETDGEYKRITVEFDGSHGYMVRVSDAEAPGD